MTHPRPVARRLGISRLGIIGGSFNPPHVGHLAIASDVHAMLGLERVLFVPAAAPVHKDVDFDVPAEVRVEMIADAAGAAAVLAAARGAHPYEEPAIDVYPLQPAPLGGFGCIGLRAPERFASFLRRAAAALGAEVALRGETVDMLRPVRVVSGASKQETAPAARAKRRYFLPFALCNAL